MMIFSPCFPLSLSTETEDKRADGAIHAASRIRCNFYFSTGRAGSETRSLWRLLA